MGEAVQVLKMAMLILLAMHLLVPGSLVTAQECINNEIRTVMSIEDGNDYIQYCVSGEWRLHCTGENVWRNPEANVACRQLGYNGVTEVLFGPRDDNPGEASTDNFFRFGAQCVGTKSSVQECGGDVQELDNCDKVHGIAECQPANCTNGEIRLVNGSTNREGRVEVCVDGRWGTVCNNQEGLAGAVCAQLGLPLEGATLRTFSPSTPPSLTCTVQSGADPIQCTTGSCDLSPSLGVVCSSHQEASEILRNEVMECETNRNKIITESSEMVSKLNKTLEQCVTRQSSATTPALGAVIGLLVVVLMVGAVGWTVTCVKLKRERKIQENTSKQADKSCDQAYAAVTNIADNPAYELFKRDQGEENTYEVVDQ